MPGYLEGASFEAPEDPGQLGQRRVGLFLESRPGGIEENGLVQDDHHASIADLDPEGPRSDEGPEPLEHLTERF